MKGNSIEKFFARIYDYVLFCSSENLKISSVSTKQHDVSSSNIKAILIIEVGGIFGLKNFLRKTMTKSLLPTTGNCGRGGWNFKISVIMQDQFT